MRRWAALGAAAVVAAAVAAAGASAHANLLLSRPAAGAALAGAPAVVRLEFNDTVRPAGGIAVVRNGGGSVLAGVPRIAGGRRLVLPLREGLPDGDYTVRWRVISDDGHPIAGVFAFAVGSGRPPPTPTLAAGGGPPARDVLRRWVFFSGALLAAGLLGVRRLISGTARGSSEASVQWRPALAAETALVSTLVAASLLAVTLACAHGGGIGATRFDRVNTLAAVTAGLGAVAAATALAYPPLLVVAEGAALVVLVVPALRGHALDPGHSRVLALGADLAHLAAAAAWLGGLLYLAVVVPAAGQQLEPSLRHTLQLGRARRISGVAVLAVLVLAASGLLRALGELSAVTQLWTTGYGRALLVKSGLLGALVAIGWQNRRSLRGHLVFGPLRRRAAAELLLFAGVIVAVAVLTDLRPGRQSASARASAAVAETAPLTLPASAAHTVVVAREVGPLAVALAARPSPGGVSLTATVLGPNGLGVNGLRVAFDVHGAVRARAVATPCGGGCYHAVGDHVGRPRLVVISLAGAGVSGRLASFVLPRRWPAPPAAGLVRKAEGAYRRVRTLVLHEQLASGPGTRNRISTLFEYVAPDRMRYRIAGGGPQGIVIGKLRWDRVSPGGRWQVSAEEPLAVPRPFWLSASHASLLASTVVRGRPVYVVSFLDRRIPAWFTAWIDRRTYRTLELRMTAAAHFMHHVYGPFDAPLTIRPPLIR